MTEVSEKIRAMACAYSVRKLLLQTNGLNPVGYAQFAPYFARMQTKLEKQLILSKGLNDRLSTSDFFLREFRPKTVIAIAQIFAAVMFITA